MLLSVARLLSLIQNSKTSQTVSGSFMREDDPNSRYNFFFLYSSSQRFELKPAAMSFFTTSQIKMDKEHYTQAVNVFFIICGKKDTKVIRKKLEESHGSPSLAEIKYFGSCFFCRSLATSYVQMPPHPSPWQPPDIFGQPCIEIGRKKEREKEEERKELLQPRDKVLREPDSKRYNQ